MKGLALILFLCVLVESIWISFPITLLFIVLISIFRNDYIDLLAFLAGVILDLMTLRTLGVDSIFFLLLIYIGGRYREKIYEGAFIYRFLFLLITLVIYNWLFYKSFNPFSVLIIIILSTVLLLCFEKIFPEKNKRRLAV